MLLTESSHVSFVYEEAECSLVVLSTGAQDGGVYTCTARNLAGEVSCKAELAVHSGGLEFKERRAECLLPGSEPLAKSLTYLAVHSLPPTSTSPNVPLRPPFLLLICLLHLPCPACPSFCPHSSLTLPS